MTHGKKLTEAEEVHHAEELIRRFMLYCDEHGINAVDRCYFAAMLNGFAIDHLKKHSFVHEISLS